MRRFNLFKDERIIIARKAIDNAMKKANDLGTKIIRILESDLWRLLSTGLQITLNENLLNTEQKHFFKIKFFLQICSFSLGHENRNFENLVNFLSYSN